MFDNCIFWAGVVENNIDPQQRGRVQVRVFGSHDIYTKPMTEADSKDAWIRKYNNSSNSAGILGSDKPPTNSGTTSVPGSSGDRYGGLPKYDTNGNRLPVWQRFNNPCNLGTYRFEDISFAYPAYWRQLTRYYHNWHDTTLAKMIYNWAPPSENDTVSYLNYVAVQTGLNPNDNVDVGNIDLIAKMLQAMTVRESGLQFSVDEIKSALNGNVVPAMTNLSTVRNTDGTLTKVSSTSKPQKPAGSESSSNNNNSSSLPNTPIQTPASPSGIQSSNEGKTTGHYLPTEDLPWAMCLYSPVLYGGTSFSTLPAPQVQNGAMVFGISLDGSFMNSLLVLGILPNSINISEYSKNIPSGTNALGSQQLAQQRQENNIPNLDIELSGLTAERLSGIIDNISGIISGGSTSGSEGDSSNAQGNTNKTENKPIEDKLGVSFKTLVTGIWNAETQKSTNKTPSEFGMFGAMQIAPATAAEYLLKNSNSEEFKNAGWELTPDMKNTLEYIRFTERSDGEHTLIGFWGSDIYNAQELNPKVTDFCNTLQENDTLNIAIASANIRDCAIEANYDPVLSVMYYNQGPIITKEILNNMNITNNAIPNNISYLDFITEAQPYVQGNIDLHEYIETVYKESGGISGIELTRTAV